MQPHLSKKERGATPQAAFRLRREVQGVALEIRARDVNREKVEMFFDKCLLNIPPGTVDIPSFGMRGDRAYLTTACEDGTKIESSESIPADKDKYQYVLVGTIDSTGCFHPLSPESADGDAQRSTP